MRKIGALLAALLLPLFSLAAAAETETGLSVGDQPMQKVISFEIEDNVGCLIEEPREYTFWEYPLLTAGGKRKTGSLKLCNHTNQSVHLYLDSVTLPYENDAALEYLAALRITITQGGEELYAGPYSKLNDAGGILTDFYLIAGEEREWNFELFCPFSYAGEAEKVSEPCVWNFRATAHTSRVGPVNVESEESWQQKAAILLIGAVLVLVVCVIAGLVHYVRSARHHK